MIMRRRYKKEMTQAFKKVKEKLEQTLSIYGSVECVDHVSDDDYLSYDVCLKVESDDPGIYCVEVYASSTGAFQLAKQSISFYVEELEELEKIISIFYGSPFSLEIERIHVLWPRYLIKIPLLELKSLPELIEHVRLLKILLSKVSKIIPDI